MRDDQWEALLRIIDGEEPAQVPVGFIVDSVWLPGWAGCSVLDYYVSEELWIAANLKAVSTFPDVMFFPGFWAEYGMISEPSAFGVKCLWAENELPFPEKVIRSYQEAAALTRPDVTRDGLLPFMTRRLQHALPRIQAAGHKVRFSVSRGPLNIATFLFGGTEFLLGLKIEPEATHKLLRVITDFLIDWHRLQKRHFPAIDGCLLLDDLIGFVGEEDFRAFGLPYFKEIYSAVGATARFLHNDAPGLVSAPWLPEMGVNMFNFSFEHTLATMRELTRGRVVLVGNIPPRDRLAAATPQQIEADTRKLLAGLPDRKRLVLSCGGGVPPGVTTEQMQALARAAQPR